MDIPYSRRLTFFQSIHTPIWIATSILILTLSFVIVLCLQETHLLIFDIDLLYDLLN